jgi:hypothetical protein
MVVKQTVRSFEGDLAIALLRPEYPFELIPDVLERALAGWRRSSRGGRRAHHGTTADNRGSVEGENAPKPYEDENDPSQALRV